MCSEAVADSLLVKEKERWREADLVALTGARPPVAQALNRAEFENTEKSN